MFISRKKLDKMKKRLYKEKNIDLRVIKSYAGSIRVWNREFVFYRDNRRVAVIHSHNRELAYKLAAHILDGAPKPRGV